MHPIHTTSALYPTWVRDDTPRAVDTACWAELHAEIVARLPHLIEYNQHHFSISDHGYWPATPGVGTAVAPTARMNGIFEVRHTGLTTALMATVHMGEIFDAQNLFDCVVLGKLTESGGGRWWTIGHDDTVAHRTVVLLRRQQGVRSDVFSRFLHEGLGPALHAAGASDLRTYKFMPFTMLARPMPRSSYGRSANHRYHGALVIGANTRQHMQDLLASPVVSAVIDDQADVLTAAHAYAVAKTTAVIRNDRIVRPRGTRT